MVRVTLATQHISNPASRVRRANHRLCTGNGTRWWTWAAFKFVDRICNDRPWRFQIDYFGVCNVVYNLLHCNYMEIVQAAPFGRHSAGADTGTPMACRHRCKRPPPVCTTVGLTRATTCAHRPRFAMAASRAVQAVLAVGRVDPDV